MHRDILKKLVAKAALDYISPGSIIGIGTGSTMSYFIEYLGHFKNLINGAVSSSNSSTFYLKKLGIPIYNLSKINSLMLYIDSADEINPSLQMIKGGGAALTREKIIAAVAKKFICIVDDFKQVNVLGRFPLPIEIIPMSFSYICFEIFKLGGDAKLRKDIVTDNGNIIIDVYNLKIHDPISMENKINSFPGVVSVGLFANRTADIVLVGQKNGSIKVIKHNN